MCYQCAALGTQNQKLSYNPKHTRDPFNGNPQVFTLSDFLFPPVLKSLLPNPYRKIQYSPKGDKVGRKKP